MSKVEKYIGEAKISEQPTKKLTWMINDDVVATNHIKDNAITTGKISGTVDPVTGEYVTPPAVTTSKIADRAVTNEKIAEGAVTDGKIHDGAITLDKFDPAFLVTERMIATGAITTNKIEDYNPNSEVPTGVTTQKIADGNVTTDKIADYNVTEAKIAAGAVTTDKLAPGLIEDLQEITDSEPTAGSVKPVQSGGVAKVVSVINKKIGEPSIVIDIVKESGTINNSSGLFQLVGYHSLISVGDCLTVKMQAQEGKPMVYTFLTSNNLVVSSMAPFADGYSGNVITGDGAVVEVSVPENAKYLYVLHTATDNVVYLPKEIYVSGDYFVSLDEFNESIESINGRVDAISGNVSTLNEDVETIESKLPAENAIYTVTNATFGSDSITFNNGKLWWCYPDTNTWHSTSEITETYSFGTSTTQFLVYDTVENTVNVKTQITQIVSTDVILLQHNPDGFKGGKLYGQYLNSCIDGLNISVGTIGTTVSTLNEGVSTLNEDVSELNVNVAGIDNSVDIINTKINGKNVINVSSLSGIHGTITNATGIFSTETLSKHALVDVEGSDYVKLKTQAGKPIVYAFLKNGNLVNGEMAPFADGYTLSVVTDSDVTVVAPVPGNAKYLYLLYSANNGVNYLPSEITLFVNALVLLEEQNIPEEKRVVARNNIGAASLTEIKSNDGSIYLRQGSYNNSLNFVDNDTKTVSTTPTSGGKLIEVNDDYRIKTVVLLDRNFKPVDVSNNILQDSSVAFNFPAYSSRKSWGIDNVPDGYYIVMSFCHKDGYDISADDAIIKNVFDIYSNNLHPINRDDHYLGNCLKRSNQVQNIVYKPVTKIPIITNYSTSAYKEVPNGATLLGLPYGSVKEMDKFVPFNVSFKTFMTAIHNKRSLIYTEIVSSAYSRSSYGFTYHGTGCATYYAIACNWNVANVIGWNIPKNTNEIPGISGMSLVYDSASVDDLDINVLKPFDVVVRNGHVLIITNIYADNFGKNRVVAISEADVPYARTSLYTEDMLNDRLHNGDYEAPSTNPYKVYRYSFPDNGEWSDIYRRSPFVQGDFEEYIGYKYNDDICTFAGDEAKFIEGEKIVLNINKGNYTLCQLFKDNTLIETITLSENDEIDLDLSSYNLTDGSYKARLSDGTNYSDFTYFEVYDVSLSVDSSKKVSFECSRLTPLYFEFQGISGSFTQRVELNATDIENGYKVMTREFSNATYIKLFAKADDGYVVTKRIVYNV